MLAGSDRTIGVVGLGVSGLTAYAFLAIAGRVLGPASFAPLGVLWSVVFLATAALATPLEIAVSRSVATARGRLEAPWAATAAGLVVATAITMAAGAAAVAASGWLDVALFGGQKGFAGAGTLAFGGLMLGAVLKGTCTGGNRLAGWGAYLVVDGATRLVLAALVAALAPSPIAFAAAISVGPWIALLAPIAWLRHLLADRHAGPTGHSITAMARAALPLVAAGAAAASLTYLGAVLLPALVPSPDARVGATIGAISLARVPLFALSPLIAIEVPCIAFANETGNVADALRAAAVLVGVAIAGSMLVVLVALAAGEGALSAVFGSLFAIPTGSLDAIAIAAASWLVATASASVSIGLQQGRLAVFAWSTGLAVAAVAATVFGPDPFARTDAAVALGSITAAAVAAATAALALRRAVPRIAARASP